MRVCPGSKTQMEREESPFVLMFSLFGLFIFYFVVFFCGGSHGQHKHLRGGTRAEEKYYITPLIYSIFCSSTLNHFKTLPLPSGWAAAARLWIGHIFHRPGWAAPLLPSSLSPSCSLSLFLSLSPTLSVRSLSLCSLLLSPTLFPSLSNPLAPSSPPPPQLSAVDALLTYSMDSGGEGGEGWMEDQWEKW